MTRKLSDADRAAIDLVLDRLNTADGKSSGDTDYAMTAPIAEEGRLAAVQQIVKLLGAMPAHEPPADLAIRTLQKIARTAGSTVPTVPGHFADPTQPMA